MLRPTVVATRPAVQSKQTVAAAVAAALPSCKTMHTMSRTEGKGTSDTEHRGQSDRPGSGCALPGAHTRQYDAPVSRRYMPEGHSVQVVLRETFANLPGAQSLQAERDGSAV